MIEKKIEISCSNSEVEIQNLAMGVPKSDPEDCLKKTIPIKKHQKKEGKMCGRVDC